MMRSKALTPVAGIGGFDLGFECAGFRTAWQVEINPIHQQVLRAHFPRADQFSDVRACGAHNLAPVDVLTAGFPCQDISTMGASRKDKTQPKGLAGSRSGLFHEVIRIAREIQPAWLVLENVPNLLTIMMAVTCKQSSKPLPTAGMWDFGVCWMLNISESPRVAVGSSWLRVLDAIPHWSCWVTPVQWNRYLARLGRSKSHGSRMDTLPILYWPPTPAPESVWVVRISSVMPDDGMRWLSGPERLRLMGFPWDWTMSTGIRLSRLETQCRH